MIELTCQLCTGDDYRDPAIRATVRTIRHPRQDVPVSVCANHRRQQEAKIYRLRFCQPCRLRIRPKAPTVFCARCGAPLVMINEFPPGYTGDFDVNGKLIYVREENARPVVEA